MFFFIHHFALRQVFGENKTIIGNSSSLPASISIINTIFEPILKKSKFFVGPRSSSPGPILLKQATTPEKQVVMLYPSIDNKSVDITVIET